MKKNILDRKTVRRMIELAVLVVLFVVLLLLKRSRKVCEFFARTISRWWIFIFGNIFGVVPISFYELFLIAVICGAITLVVFLCVFLAKRRWRSLVSAVLISALTVFSFLNIYTATASFSYGRDELPAEVYNEFSGKDLTYEQADELATAMVHGVIAAYNETKHDADGNIEFPYTFREISNLVAQEFYKLPEGYFSSYTPRTKRVLNKTIMSELGITGVFFAPFGEANINGNENNMYLPYTIAHEIAHGKGVMVEYKANLIAAYVLLDSENPYLRYSALVKCVYQSIALLRLYPNSSPRCTELNAELDASGVPREIANVSQFYRQFDLLEKVGDFFNDMYLKFQKQEGGSQSYTKPGVSQGTGEKDDFEQEIVEIRSFSNIQNLLILMYKQGKLNRLTSN